MGHFTETLVGRGKSYREALDAAWEDYVYEHGHRCTLSEVLKSTRQPDVPPVKGRERVESYVDRYGRRRESKVWSSEPDPTAPKSEWLQEWEFEVDVHA